MARCVEKRRREQIHTGNKQVRGTFSLLRIKLDLCKADGAWLSRLLVELSLLSLDLAPWVSFAICQLRVIIQPKVYDSEL